MKDIIELKTRRVHLILKSKCDIVKCLFQFVRIWWVGVFYYYVKYNVKAES